MLTWARRALVATFALSSMSSGCSDSEEDPSSDVTLFEIGFDGSSSGDGGEDTVEADSEADAPDVVDSAPDADEDVPLEDVAVDSADVTEHTDGDVTVDATDDLDDASADPVVDVTDEEPAPPEPGPITVNVIPGNNTPDNWFVAFHDPDGTPAHLVDFGVAPELPLVATYDDFLPGGSFTVGAYNGIHEIRTFTNMEPHREYDIVMGGDFIEILIYTVGYVYFDVELPAEIADQVTQISSDLGCAGVRYRDAADEVPFFHDISNMCTLAGTPDDLAIHALDADGTVLATAHTENQPFVAVDAEWTDSDVVTVVAEDWSLEPTVLTLEMIDPTVDSSMGFNVWAAREGRFYNPVPLDEIDFPSALPAASTTTFEWFVPPDFTEAYGLDATIYTGPPEDRDPETIHLLAHQTSNTLSYDVAALYPPPFELLPSYDFDARQFAVDTSAEGPVASDAFVINIHWCDPSHASGEQNGAWKILSSDFADLESLELPDTETISNFLPFENDPQITITYEIWRVPGAVTADLYDLLGGYYYPFATERVAATLGTFNAWGYMSPYYYQTADCPVE